MDKSDKPIPYATIYSVVNKHVVSVCLKDGTYQIYVNCEGDTLVYTQVNYQPDTVFVDGNKMINVKLQYQAAPINTVDISDTECRKLEKKTTIDSKNGAIEDWPTRVEVPSVIPRQILVKLQSYLKQKADSLHKIDSLAGVCGNVKVGVSIGTNGKSTKEILLTGIHKVYDDMVLEAIKAVLICIPAEQNGIKVESYQEIVVNL